MRQASYFIQDTKLPSSAATVAVRPSRAQGRRRRPRDASSSPTLKRGHPQGSSVANGSPRSSVARPSPGRRRRDSQRTDRPPAGDPPRHPRGERAPTCCSGWSRPVGSSSVLAVLVPASDRRDTPQHQARTFTPSPSDVERAKNFRVEMTASAHTVCLLPAPACDRNGLRLLRSQPSLFADSVAALLHLATAPAGRFSASTRS